MFIVFRRSLEIFFIFYRLGLTSPSCKESPHKRHSSIYFIPIRCLPPNTLARTPYHSQSACNPQRSNCRRNSVHNPPCPLPPHCARLPTLGDILTRQLEILRSTTDKVITRYTHEHSVEGVGNDRVMCDSVGEKPQPDTRRRALDLLRYDALHEDMRDEHGVQYVSCRGGQAEFGPGNPATVGARLGAVAHRVDPPAVDAQGHAGDDMRYDRGEDQERLEGEGLVVRPREKEVFICFHCIPCEERDERGVGVVHCQVERGREGCVFLHGGEDVQGPRGRKAEEIRGCPGCMWELGGVNVGGVGRVESWGFLVDRRGFDFVHGHGGNRGAGVARGERGEFGRRHVRRCFRELVDRRLSGHLLKQE